MGDVKKFCFIIFSFFVFPILLFSPAFADEELHYPRLEAVTLGGSSDHFQTTDGGNVTLPLLTVGAWIGITPALRIEVSSVSGSSGISSDAFKTAVSDFEGRLSFRLDALKAPNRDGIGQNVYGWTSWKIWSSQQLETDGTVDNDREEGLGLGISRYPMQGRFFSYAYGFAFYPSVRVRIGQAVSRINLEAGPAFNINRNLQVAVTYRYKHILTDGLPHQRAQEQGPSAYMRIFF